LTEQGCFAYDSGLGKEVLITSSLLCFLADSPMHAEITSTFMPGHSRNPCRACDLSVSSVSMKKTMAYLQFFLQISADGDWVSLIMLHIWLRKVQYSALTFLAEQIKNGP
jgi:hypothetical protein